VERCEGVTVGAQSANHLILHRRWTLARSVLVWQTGNMRRNQKGGGGSQVGISIEKACKRLEQLSWKVTVRGIQLMVSRREGECRSVGDGLSWRQTKEREGNPLSWEKKTGGRLIKEEVQLRNSETAPKPQGYVAAFPYLSEENRSVAMQNWWNQAWARDGEEQKELRTALHKLWRGRGKGMSHFGRNIEARQGDPVRRIKGKKS